MTTPTSSSNSASKSWRRWGTIPPIGAPASRGAANGATPFPSGSSTRTTTSPRWTSWSRCWPGTPRSPAGRWRSRAKTRARSSKSCCEYGATSVAHARARVTLRSVNTEGRFRPLVAELKRRRVFRALIGYGVVGFAVLQIIEPVMHGLHWPDAVLSYVVVALAVGFPVVLMLAWIFDVNKGRIERTAGKPLRTGMALALAGVGLLVAAPGAVYYLVVRRATPAQTPQGPSVAVLPLVNLSSDKEQEYFSDGLSEHP